MSVRISSLTSRPVLPVLGTMTYADQTDIHDAKQQIEYFTSLGYDRVDTARMYSYGKTEEMLGVILSENCDFEDKLIVDSKVNPFRGYDDNLTPKNVFRQMDNILRALQCESIQALYLHAPGIHLTCHRIAHDNTFIRR